MKKEFKVIDVQVLDLTETGTQIETQIDVKDIGKDSIAAELDIIVGTPSKDNYRYFINISVILHDFYKGQNFQNENEIKNCVKDILELDIEDLIQCYDGMVMNQTNAS